MDRSLEIDRLLADRGWLTQVARGLTRDAEHVDDAIQEAAAAALVTPPEHERALGAWFATVMRNGLARHRRSTERREARERRVARVERLPSTLTAVERVELQRNVAEAVLALAEPYRTPITLRYFAGLSTTEIASSEGVPAATVRTRIHRGLAQLRSRLDRSYGRRDAWHAPLVAVAALGRDGSAASASGGVLTLATGSKLATQVGAAILVLVLAVAGYLILDRESPPPPLESADTVASFDESNEAPTADTRESAEDNATPPVKVETGADAAAPPRGADATAGAIVSGRVTAPSDDADEAPIPIADAQLMLTLEEDDDRRGRESTVHLKTDEDGMFTTEKLAPGRWRIFCNSPRYRWYNEELPIEDWQREITHDIQLEEKILVRVRFETPEGERVAPMLRSAGLKTFGRLTAIATEARPPARLPATDRDGPDTYGLGRYHDQNWPGGPELTIPGGYDGYLELDDDKPVYVAAILKTAVLATELLESGQRDVVLVVPFETAMASLATLRMRVIDDDTGQPLPDAKISIGNNNLAVTGIDVEPDGTYERKALGPGLWGVSVTCEEYEHVQFRLSFAPGQVHDLGDVALERGTRLRGRILGPDGRGVDASFYLIELGSFDPDVPLHLSGLRGTRDGGRFTLPPLGSGRHALVVATHRLAHQAITFDPSLDAGQELVIETREGTPVRFDTRYGKADLRVVHILDEAGVPVFSSNVRGGFGSFERLRLPPGVYELIQSDGVGGRTSSEFLIEQGREVELVLGE